jgi:hypothetical protein
MKNWDKFFEDYQYDNVDLQSQIDEILDNLNNKGELSKSEKKFLKDVSNGKVIEISKPKKQKGQSFWAMMSNPHNLGIMWNNGTWNILNTLEEEIDNDDSLDSDEKYELKRKNEIKNYFKKYKDLKSELEELLKRELKIQEFSKKIREKYRKLSNNDYNFMTKIDYATNGLIESLINQFGDEDDNGEPYIF